MTSSAFENLIAAADTIARELPPKLLHGRAYVEFSDDEVPLCTNCEKLCEWLYISPAAKKVEDTVETWCAWCSQARIDDGVQSWKVHVRAGLHEHFKAVARLRSQAPAQHPQPAGIQQQARDEAIPQPESSRPAAAASPSANERHSQSPPRVTEREDPAPHHLQLPSFTDSGNPKQWSGKRGKFYEKIRMIVRQYFVEGEETECRTSGAEILKQYRKHWKNDPIQWKVLYEVVSSLGFHCSQETVISMHGKTKQVTRVVRGLKLR